MFRVTFRNNSFSSINRPFSLSLMTLADPTTRRHCRLACEFARSAALQTAAVDIRMPLEAMRPGLAMMQAIVDSHREIGEINESNNVLLVKLAEVRPIATEKAIAAPGDRSCPGRGRRCHAASRNRQGADGRRARRLSELVATKVAASQSKSPSLCERTGRAVGF